MINIEKFKSTLIQIVDFIIGVIVFFCVLYGTAIFLKDIFHFEEINSFCLIVSFLMVGRFVIKLNSKYEVLNKK